MLRRTVIALVIGTLTAAIVGCGTADPDDQSQQESDSEPSAYSVAVNNARLLGKKDGEHRLYVVAKVTNHSYGEDLGVNVNKLQVVTDGAGALNSGFHGSDVPEEVEKCTTSNFGTPVAERTSLICGFVVRNKSEFQPVRLRYYPKDLFRGEPVSAQFPKTVPSP